MRAYIFYPAVYFAAFTAAQTTTTCTVTSQPVAPTDAVCNQQGSLKNPSTISKTNKNTQALCRDSCLNNDPACVAFSYGPKKTCKTYNKKLAVQGFKKSNTGVSFWARKCYGKKCGLCPPGLGACGGLCINFSTDANNCGSCNHACGLDGSSETTCCQGQCISLQTDANNCGRCGNVCGADGSSATSCCSGGCVDLQTDRFNCGSCGNKASGAGIGQDCCGGQIKNRGTQENCNACASCGGETSCNFPKFPLCICPNAAPTCGTKCCKGSEGCISGECHCGNGRRCDPNNPSEHCISGDPSRSDYKYNCGDTRCCYIQADQKIGPYTLGLEMTRLKPDVRSSVYHSTFAPEGEPLANDAKFAAQQCYSGFRSSYASFIVYFTSSNKRWNCYAFRNRPPPNTSHDNGIETFLYYQTDG